jgi:uncharacterized small protein (DUF1192 family)
MSNDLESRVDDLTQRLAALQDLVTPKLRDFDPDRVIHDIHCLKYEVRELKASRPTASDTITNDIDALKREVGLLKTGESEPRSVPDGSSDVKHDIHALKHEIRRLKLSEASGTVHSVHSLKYEVRSLKLKLDGDVINVLRAEIETLKTDVANAKVEFLGMSEEVAVLKRSLKLTRKEVEERESGSGNEETIGKLVSEVEALKKQVGTKQVFVDLPRVAAVQLVFRGS